MKQRLEYLEKKIKQDRSNIIPLILLFRDRNDFDLCRDMEGREFRQSEIDKMDNVSINKIFRVSTKNKIFYADAQDMYL